MVIGFLLQCSSQGHQAMVTSCITRRDSQGCPGHPLPQHGLASLAWCHVSQEPWQLQQTTFRGGKGGSIPLPHVRLQCCKDCSWYGGGSNHLPLPPVSVQNITSLCRQTAGIKQRLNRWWAWLLLRLFNTLHLGQIKCCLSPAEFPIRRICNLQEWH